MSSVYISGAITGVKNYKKNFERACNILEPRFSVVINPAEIEGENYWTWEDYMCECMKVLPYCTHIFMLKGWEKSRGANIELLVANSMGLTVIYEEAFLKDVS